VLQVNLTYVGWLGILSSTGADTYTRMSIKNQNDKFWISVDSVLFKISRKVLESHGSDNLLLDLAECNESPSSTIKLCKEMVDPASFWFVWKHLHHALNEDDLDDMSDTAIDRLHQISDYLCLPALCLQLECTKLDKKKRMEEKNIQALKQDSNLHKIKLELDKAKSQIADLQSQLQSEQRSFKDGGHYTHDNRDRCNVRCKKPLGHVGYCKF